MSRKGQAMNRFIYAIVLILITIGLLLMFDVI